MSRHRRDALDATGSGEAAGPDSAWIFLLVGIMLFTFGMMLVSFPVGFYTVFGTHISNNDTASTAVHGLTFDVLFVTFEIPIAGTLGDIFIVCSLIYFVFLALAATQGAGFLRSMKASTSQGYQAFFTSPLAATMVLLGATSLVTVLVDSIQTSAGVSTGSITGDPFALLVDFTLAPLLEETEFRVIMIGIPVLLLFLVMIRQFSASKVLRLLWRPSSVWDYDETEEDGRVRTFKDSGFSIFPAGSDDSLKVRAMKPVVYVFLVLSSFLFGYAHYAAGSGWGPGKISEAALAGLALGYLYIKYGLHTDILLHWSINYVGTIFSFLAQGLYGISYTSASGSWLDVVPSLDMVFLLGVPCTLIVLNELLKRVLPRRSVAPAS